eukprot:1235809-Amphidinium_carterae.1
MSWQSFRGAPVISQHMQVKEVSVDTVGRVVSVRLVEGTEIVVDCSEDAWSQRKILHMSSDMGPKSWSAVAYLSWCGVRLTQTADVLHRTHNNWTMALSSSGLGGVRAELRHLMAVRNGPFRSGGTHALLLEAASLMVSGECWRHALWHHMYPL